jgi:transposase
MNKRRKKTMGTTANYREEFKMQIVELIKSGKSVSDISREYKVTKPTLRLWVKRYNNSGEFGAEANRSEGEKDIRALQKENRQLRMENDILKQAAL